ncbi:MAG: hypothetical protein ACXIVQ_16955 [Acidimicrobiales bacterium]
MATSTTATTSRGTRPSPRLPRQWPQWARAVAVLVGLAILSVLIVLGIRLLDRRDFSSVTLGGPVTRIDIQVAEGHVELHPASGDDVVVERTADWRLRRPRSEAYVDGATVRIRAGCPRGLVVVGSCSVTHRIEVPDGVRVDVRTDSGRVWLYEVTGWVRVVTTEGRVVAEGLRSPEVLVDTSGGSVHLDFADAPSRVEVLSGGSNVTLGLPGGPYEFALRSGDGEVDVRVDAEELAERTVAIDSGGGDVWILPPGVRPDD